MLPALNNIKVLQLWPVRLPFAPVGVPFAPAPVRVSTNRNSHPAATTNTIMQLAVEPVRGDTNRGISGDTNRGFANLSRRLLLMLFGCLCSLTIGFAQNINKPNKTGPLGTEVNTFSGNLYIPRSDLYIAARGLELNMLFSYNSFNYDINYGYGNGWSFQYGSKYKIDSTGAVVIFWGDGREDRYTSSGSNYVAPTGNFNVLTQYQPGKFQVRTKYGQSYFFDNSQHKRLTKISDPNGNSLNLSYTDSLVSSISTTAGQTISMSYTAGRLSSTTDANASLVRTVFYEYDNAGNLIKVTDPLGNKWQYRYLTNGPLTGITDKNMNEADIIYTPDFAVSELIGCNSRKSFSYDTTQNKTTITDYVPESTNQVTTYAYKKYDQQIWLTGITGNCCGYNLAYEFDNAGNIIKKTDANGNVSTYTYDSRGNLLTTTDPLNNVNTYVYSADYNLPVSYTDPKGNTFSISYDNKGNLLQASTGGSISTSATVAANGDIVTLTDENGNTYRFTYDAYGKPTQIAGPLNYALGLSYNARGELLSYTDPNAKIYALEYDKLGRMTKAINPLNENFQMVYDANGNIISLKDQKSLVDSFYYDASNRLAGFRNRLGKRSQYGYDAMDNLTQYRNKLGQTSRFAYDNRNRLATITDALGNKKTFSYDNNGNPLSVKNKLGNIFSVTYDKLNRIVSATDAAGQLVTIAYDKNGKMTSFTSGTGTTTSFTYNGLNQVTAVTDALGNSSTFGYDKKGNITSIRDKAGKTSFYTFDSLNRRAILKDNNGFTIKADYDAAGNIVKLTDQNNQSTLYNYDALGRPVTKTYPNGSYENFVYDAAGNLLSKRSADGSLINYSYDAANRQVSKTLPGNNVSIYAYNDINRIVSAANGAGTVAYTYDALGRPTSESFDGLTTNYEFNLANRTSKITYPGGSVIARNYDIRGRLTSITKNNVPVVSYQYNNANKTTATNFANGFSGNLQYDFASRLNTRTSSNSNVPSLDLVYDNTRNITMVSRPADAEQYGYDMAHRLTAYTRGSSIQKSYTYDSAGNRKTQNNNGLLTTYNRNNLNQLTSAVNTAQTIAFTYDNNGNLTYDGSFYKRYDAEGRLVLDSATGNIIAYQYDAVGRQVKKIKNGNAVNYYFSGFSPVEQRNGQTGAVINETVFNGSITPVMLSVQNRDYYYHQNHLNSVEAITNAQGMVAEKYQYDDFGNTTVYDSLGNVISTSVVGNTFGFTGQQYNADTKNYHFFYRTYNPATGLFNQRDPIGYGDGMAAYQYVHNNPGNLIDPLGLAPCPPNHAPTPGFETPNADPNFGPLGLPGEVTNDFLNAISITTVTQLFKSTQSVALSTGSTLIGAAATPFNAVSLVNSANDFASNSYTNTASQNVIQGADVTLGTTTLVTGTTAGLELVSTFGIPAGEGLSLGGAAAAGPGGALVATYIVGNAISKALPAFPGRAATETSLPERLYPLSEAIGDIPADVSQILHIRQEYERILQEMGQDKAEEYLRIIQRINDQQEYNRTHPRPRNPVPTPNNQPCPDNPNGTQKPNPRRNPDGTPIHTEVINSKDPNEIIGPDGSGIPKWVSVKDNLPYTINYENSKSASAPAKKVRINYPIDSKQDKNTFALGSFGFNNLTFSVPPNTASYYQRLNTVDSLGLYVDVTAGLDVVNNQAFWIFESIDPTTLLPTTNPLQGFLLLQDTALLTKGHGFVNFTIKPLSTDITGDTMHATGTIVFDGNDTIPTNYAKNTIDAAAPSSHMNTAPAVSNTDTFPLSWGGTDDFRGSGVRSYGLYYSVNGGIYALLRNGIARTDTTFTGSNGNTYRFFVLATDTAGNVEALKSGAEVTVLVNSGMILPVNWLSFTATLKGKDGLLNWATASEANSKMYVIERSVNGRSFIQIGTVNAAGNSSIRSNYSFTDSDVVALNIPLVYYRLKQLDKNGGYTYSAIVAVPLPTANLAPSVQVYPNPFREALNLMMANMPATTTGDNISLYTLDGKVVYSKTTGAHGTNATITLDDLPSLTPGIYVLKLVSGKQTYTFKLMKE